MNEEKVPILIKIASVILFLIAIFIGIVGLGWQSLLGFSISLNNILYFVIVGFMVLIPLVLGVGLLIKNKIAYLLIIGLAGFITASYTISFLARGFKPFLPIEPIIGGFLIYVLIKYRKVYRL